MTRRFLQIDSYLHGNLRDGFSSGHGLHALVVVINSNKATLRCKLSNILKQKTNVS